MTQKEMAMELGWKVDRVKYYKNHQEVYIGNNKMRQFFKVKLFVSE